MSINVSVSGNPTNIKRGRMVTYDADAEFEHRRRIRLQQVREQSKEIAADVRSRVRKEREKQFLKAEKKGEQDLKRWQTSKLLALQQQHQEFLKEVGSAHTKAASAPDDNKILKEQAEKHQKEANKRQEIASNKARKDEEKIQLELRKPIELRKEVRKFEDERAAMVTKLNQQPDKKSKAVFSDSDSIHASDKENISSNINLHRTRRTPRDRQRINQNVSSPENLSHLRSKSKKTSPKSKSPDSSPKSRSPTPPKFQKITKISNRIKDRKAAGSEKTPKKKKLQINTYNVVDIPGESDHKTDLPYVPTTTLTPESITSDKPIVQRINKDSIRVNSPSDKSELTEFKEIDNRRDKVAHNRGVRALETEKMQKDYQQLMKELPLLQKFERLAQMKNHNPIFHKSEDRLEELERRKQDKMENVFEKYYHKSKALAAPLVTIRPVQKPLPNDELRLPFQVLDVTEESNPQLNVAEWTTEDAQEECSDDKQKAIIDLLQKVNKQKELLLQEGSALPPRSNLKNIIQEDEMLKLIFDDAHTTQKKTVATSSMPTKSKKRAPLTSSSESSVEIKKKQKRKTHKKQKVTTNATQTSPLSDISKRRGFVCSCKSTTSGSCRCDQKTKTKKLNVCRDCGQDEKKGKSPRNIHECRHGGIYQEDIGQKLKDDTKKVCEIIIKASNETDVKVRKENEKPAGKKVILSVSKPVNINIKPNPCIDISSSTTHMSLPDQKAAKTNTSARKKTEYKDSKPKQPIIDIPDFYPCDDKKEVTPNLLRYIKKLLSMSRQSIDELTVSSVSEISTPGQSVVDVSENISSPLVELQNVMQYYNLSLNDIQMHLSELATQKQTEIYGYSTQETVSQPSSKSPQNFEEAAEIVKDTYNLTQECCERINKLTKMIDHVRIEKERLLSPDVSDKYETSLTSYLELPEKYGVHRSNGDSSSSSISQEAIDKYLLAIDKVPPPRSKKKQQISPKNQPKSLKQQVADNSGLPNPVFACLCPEDAQDVEEVPVSDKTQQPFVPMLQGIPKYSDSETRATNFVETSMKQFLLNSKTKPPPALLLNATKFNLDIDMTPHELSTIAEMSVVSEVVGKPRTPEVTNKLTRQPKDPSLPFGRFSVQSVDEIDQIPKKSSLKKSPRSSKLEQETQVPNSEKSTSSQDDVETALRNIGPSWVITTSKITKEALALSSSSSSLEASFKKRVSFQDSNSISSINSEKRDALSKKTQKQILSSTSDSLSPNLQKVPDLSDIRDPTIFPRDVSQHRTSTPVQNSKSPDSNKDLFTNDSDLSSVKMYNEELLFLSIPNVSLDTNKSLSKSK